MKALGNAEADHSLAMPEEPNYAAMEQDCVGSSEELAEVKEVAMEVYDLVEEAILSVRTACAVACQPVVSPICVTHICGVFIYVWVGCADWKR